MEGTGIMSECGIFEYCSSHSDPDHWQTGTVQQRKCKAVFHQLILPNPGCLCVVCQGGWKPQRDGYRCTHKTSKHTKACKFFKRASCLAIVIGLQEQAHVIEELKITPTAFCQHQSAFHFSERCFIGSVKKHIWPHMWFENG